MIDGVFFWCKWLLLVMVVLWGCQAMPPPAGGSASVGPTDTLNLGAPIWGYRFQITGDFDGDGGLDTLDERFINLETGAEAPKFYTNLSTTAYPSYNKDSRSTQAFLACTTPHIDTLFGLGMLGVAWLETIGDLDGDGGDEIGWVAYYADVSSVNTYQIYSFKETWQPLLGVATRDWALPPLPDYNFQYVPIILPE